MKYNILMKPRGVIIVFIIITIATVMIFTIITKKTNTRTGIKPNFNSDSPVKIYYGNFIKSEYITEVNIAPIKDALNNAKWDNRGPLTIVFGYFLCLKFDNNIRIQYNIPYNYFFIENQDGTYCIIEKDKSTVNAFWGEFIKSYRIPGSDGVSREKPSD